MSPLTLNINYDPASLCGTAPCGLTKFQMHNFKKKHSTQMNCLRGQQETLYIKITIMENIMGLLSLVNPCKIFNHFVRSIDIWKKYILF